MLTYEEIKKAKAEELQKEAQKTSTELTRVALLVRTGQSKANHEVKKMKKYRARLLTALKTIEQKGLEKEAK
jgi:ribosomal protein L29